MSQSDTLQIHLDTIQDPVAGTPCERALDELLYTASETGLIEGIDKKDAITVWKMVVLAMSFGPNIPEGLRM